MVLPGQLARTRRIGCGIGVVLLLLAAAGALAEVAITAQGVRGPVSLGWLWFQLQGNRLVAFRR